MPSLARLRIVFVLFTTVVALLLLGPGRLGDRMIDGVPRLAERAVLTGVQPEGSVLAGPIVARGALGGELGTERRDEVTAEIAEVVDAWLYSTYLPADPAQRDATAGLTQRLARDLRHDGARDQSVLRAPTLTDPAAEIRKRKVSVDLLATRGAARAATARVRLVLAPSGTTRTVGVRGRLFLVIKNGHWRIFGYDLAKGDR